MPSCLNPRYRMSFRILIVCFAILVCVSTAMSQAQSNAADLQGTVRDQNGAAVPNASVTARNVGTNFSREATSNDDGFYKIISLPPGAYEITVKATNYKTAVIQKVTVTVGQTADQDIPLEVGDVTATVTVSGGTTNVVETSSAAVSSTIDQQRVNSLPINERSATGFALTLSTVGRDNGRPIGPAPTSGLNIGGQRGRSTLVQDRFRAACRSP